MPTRPKLSRILFAHLAAAALLAWTSAASAAGSSFLGMGSETGTPTGDVRAAIEPRLHTLPVPEWVSSAKIDPKDLFRVPNPPALRRPVRIGVQASLGETSHAPWLAYTLAEIRHALGERNVRIYWLDDHSIALGAQSRQLDFFIADSHVFVLEQSMNRAEEIAAFKPSEADLAEEAQASVLFVRKDAPAHVGGTRRIVSLENLKSFRFTATTPGGLASWLAAEGLLSRRGILPSELASRTVFQGNDPSAVLDVVLKHPNTIGVLPACVLEGLEREGRVKIEAELQILNPRHGDGLACLHTTPAYPGWAFAALTTTDPAWKKAVSSLLFGMTRTGYGGEWTMPTLNRSIYDLFYELQIGPYEHLASWSFERFMRENAEGLALAVLGAFLVVTYSVSLSVMVRRKTRQLRRALAERDLIEAQAAQSRQHIANLERTGIVGQMSTIIAHELKQPLSAIMNYANGLHRRAARGRFEQESFLWALDEIVNEAERASEIVNRVRSYARHEYPPRAVTDLSEVIGNSISTFRRSRQTKAEIVVRVNEGSMAEVDAWEIELAVLNLLKNAADAVSGIESPRIEVLLEPADAKTWALSVADNGPRLTDEELSRFFQPLQTTKGAKGLGLGLSIVANIAERHAGRITVERATPECGVRFVFTFPRVARAEEDLAELGLPPKLEVFDEKTPRG